MSTPRTDVHHSALDMARRGFQVFPLIPNSKVPFTSPESKEWSKLDKEEKDWSRKFKDLRGGIHLATRSPESIAMWFARCPEMNYGVSATGFCILDVDVKDGRPGAAELDALGPLPHTLKVQTPTLGSHLYFVASVGQRKLRPAIDIRSRGGYVVGPGSQIDGKAYHIIRDEAPARLPDRIHTELARVPERDADASNVVGTLDTDAAMEAAVAFLAHEPGAGVGERNMIAFRIACQLKDIGLSPPMIKEVMCEHWNPKNDEPLPEEEIETVSYNAFKNGRHRPGSSNPREEFGDIFRELPKLIAKLLKPKYESRCLADVERKSIAWLWQDRVALGKLTQLVGLPKLGKSQLTCSMASAVTKGAPWPDGGSAPRGSVIFISGEDDAEDTIGPRLDAAGADSQRVHMFDWALTDEGKRQQFHVERHAPALREMIRAIGDVRMVVIDPVPAYMSGEDTHKTGEVRSALLPLQNLAAEEGVAVLLVNHLNKNTKEKSAINRVGGSGAFVAVCRSNWLIAADPDDSAEIENRRRRLFMSLGANIGRDKGGLAFKIEDVVLPDGIETTRLVFEAARVTKSADDVLSAVSDGAGGAVLEAEEFLRRELAGGECPSKLVRVHAMELGISTATLDRAKARLKITARKRGRDWWMVMAPPVAPGPEGEFADIFN